MPQLSVIISLDNLAACINEFHFAASKRYDYSSFRCEVTWPEMTLASLYGGMNVAIASSLHCRACLSSWQNSILPMKGILDTKRPAPKCRHSQPSQQDHLMNLATMHKHYIGASILSLEIERVDEHTRMLTRQPPVVCAVLTMPYALEGCWWGRQCGQECLEAELPKPGHLRG